MFFGTFERWAEELKPDCFYEFLRQFRVIDKEEKFKPFLENLNKFDLRTVRSIDLSDKALTSNETIQILNILSAKKDVVIETLDLYRNNIDDTAGLLFPNSLQVLNLGSNNIGDEGAKGLPLAGLSKLQTLNLGGNNIGAEGAKGLPLAALSKLTSLSLIDNNIGAEGAKGLSLATLTALKTLGLFGNNIGDEGARGLQLPLMLQFLGLSYNNITDEGVNALLKKIPKTKLTNIDLDGNPYNSSRISPNRAVQQKRLLENCQSQLCYANTLLSQQDVYQTSGAARVEPSLFFSWLKKPFDKLAEYTSDCVSTTFDSGGIRLEKVLSQSPSYFPNIHSPTIHDWQPSGSVMLHQFKAGGSNTLLLSAPQAAIRPSLSAIAR
jgi:hypothetical protein